MKKLMYTAVMAALIVVSSCKKTTDDDDNNNNNNNKEQIVELTGDLDTRTLTADKKYLLKSQVFVRNGKTLTIEPGTIILGDKRTRGVLVIDKGGKLMAEGTREKPIVFTSNQEEGIRDRGDWGGIVILGNANTNQPGPAIEGITPEVQFGTFQSDANDNESSGVLKYVRCEFGGIELTPNNETNSITMGGVGRGTVMEYCMTSYGGDDGFEWFGGTVNGKYFICHANWDDDFDCDFGWSGNVQFGLVVRYPGYADQSQSNGFECDNGPNDNDVTPYTTGTFSNITVIGPIKTGNRISNSNFAHAIDLRRRTAVSLFNSVFTGFPIGIRMNQPSVYNQYAVAANGVIENNVLVGLTGRTYAVGSGVVMDDMIAYLSGKNTINTVDNFTDEFHTSLGLNPGIFYASGSLANSYPSNPPLTVTSGTLATGAKFDNAKFQEPNRTGFFNTSVSFIGGFGSDNWASGWAEFDPVDRTY
jgi:hypothetical protein